MEATPALRVAMEFLRTRSRFEAEVRLHLSGKGFSATDVENVVQFLTERRLLNDETTTQDLVERHSGKRSLGPERLRAELKRRGAPEEMIERSLDGLAHSETERAVDALRAKYKAGAARSKAGRFLYSRGFSEAATEAALDIFCGSDFPE